MSNSKGKELQDDQAGPPKHSNTKSTTRIMPAVEGLSPAMLRRAEWVRQHHDHIGQTENAPRVGSRVWVVYSSSSRAHTFQMHPATISEVRYGAYNDSIETVSVVYWDKDSRNTHRNVNQVFFAMKSRLAMFLNPMSSLTLFLMIQLRNDDFKLSLVLPYKTKRSTEIMISNKLLLKRQ